MEDPYAALGVKRDATPDEIRAAYRKLAKQLHPDVNPDKPKIEERFKAVSAAYALLSNPEKRARFDRGEIDASGAEREPGRRFYRDFGDDAGRGKYRTETFGFEDLDLEELLGEALRQRAGGRARRGPDQRYALGVDFVTAANGGVRRLTLPDGRTLDVTIPPGLRDGQVLRLRGQGGAGVGDAPRGDALIEVSVEPHPTFRREGNDVVVELPITLREAVLGGKVRVPTIKGTLDVTVPANSSSGTRLRLRGRGIGDGDQLVELKIVLPGEAEPELAEFLRGWTPRRPFNPRREGPR
jgi:DnaJ-class molecular chaperone